MINVKKYRLFTYIFIGIVLVSGWSYINYTNYVKTNQSISAQISLNNDLVNSSVMDIEVEQRLLRDVQRVYSHMKSSTDSDLMREPSPEIVELQSRINKLESEKQRYLSKKNFINKKIRKNMTLFKMDEKNPIINIVLLPLLAYFFKKIVDLGFRRLEKKFFVC